MEPNLLKETSLRQLQGKSKERLIVLAKDQATCSKGNQKREREGGEEDLTIQNYEPLMTGDSVNSYTCSICQHPSSNLVKVITTSPHHEIDTM